jgi:hypothetical protein
MRKVSVSRRGAGFLIVVGVGVAATLSLVTRSVAHVGGGTNPATDCFASLEGIESNPANCTDCDPSCDMDGVATPNNSCTFKLQLCVNDVEAGGSCQATTLKKVKVSPKKIGLTVTPNGTAEVCGPETSVVVNLKKKGKKSGRKKFTVLAQSDSKQKDKNKFQLTCNPNPPGQPCPTTSTTTTPTPSTTTTTVNPCGNGTLDAGEQCDPPSTGTQCAAGQVCNNSCQCQSSCTPCPPAKVVTTSTPGTLQVSTLPAFPFPSGVVTTMQVGPASNGLCEHPVGIPPGGFSVPVFCIPALSFTSTVENLGCDEGANVAVGRGRLWDNNPNADPDADVTKVGDTTAAPCATLGTGCNVLAGGAGADTLGDADTTLGDNVRDSAGVHVQLEIPQRSLTWNDGDAFCPDQDGVFDPDTDTLVTEFEFVLSPTTATATATFVDKNGDGCAKAGNGPTGPVMLTGSPAAGPCCVVGQATTVAAVGVAFSGGSPLYDLIFHTTTPSTVTECGAYEAPAACTIADPCVR